MQKSRKLILSKEDMRLARAFLSSEEKEWEKRIGKAEFERTKTELEKFELREHSKAVEAITNKWSETHNKSILGRAADLGIPVDEYTP